MRLHVGILLSLCFLSPALADSVDESAALHPLTCDAILEAARLKRLQLPGMYFRLREYPRLIGNKEARVHQGKLIKVYGRSLYYRLFYDEFGVAFRKHRTRQVALQKIDPASIELSGRLEDQIGKNSLISYFHPDLEAPHVVKLLVQIERISTEKVYAVTRVKPTPSNFAPLDLRIEIATDSIVDFTDIVEQ